MGSSATDFHLVVSLGCLGQSGNAQPAAITISEPQHRLVYTPNRLLMSPLKAILDRFPLAVGVCTLADVGPNTRRGFNRLERNLSTTSLEGGKRRRRNGLPAVSTVSQGRNPKVAGTERRYGG